MVGIFTFTVLSQDEMDGPRWGAWTIFVAALIVIDSFAIYLRTAFSYLATAVKLLYPRLN